MTTQMAKGEATKRLKDILGSLSPKKTELTEPEREEIKKLLALGADPNARVPVNGKEKTLLSRAVSYNEVEIVKILLEKGAQVDGSLIDYCTAQLDKDENKVSNERKEKYKAIRSELATKRLKDILGSLSPKKTELTEPEREEIKKLLALGADPNATVLVNGKEKTLLSRAVSYNEVEIVKKLLEKGAQVDGSLIDYCTAQLDKDENKVSNERKEKYKEIRSALQSALDAQSLTPLTKQLKALEIGNDGKLKGFNEDAKSKLEALLAKAQIPEDKHAELLELAVKTGHYQVVELVINKMATGADEAKKKENAQALKNNAIDKAEELQAQWRKDHPVEGKEGAGIPTPYDDIINALTGAREPENLDEKEDFARKDETLAAWYAAVANKWKDKETASLTLIEKDEKDYTEEDKKTAARAKQESEIAAAYTKLHELEAKLATAKPEEKQEILSKLVATSSALMGLLDGYNQDYSNVLSQKGFNNQKNVLLHANGQYQGELKGLLPQPQKPKEGGRSGGIPRGNTPPTAGTTDVTIGQLPPQVTPTDLDEKTGVVTQATIDSVAHAKHDGSQEKSWWQRNQEWIWWTLGILVVAALTFFSFRKGGWFNKDDKKSSTVAVNTNTNQNTNQNTNTGNDNTNTDNSGTTNDSTNDTLANNSQLYSAKEINQAIAANRQNIGNQDR